MKKYQSKFEEKTEKVEESETGTMIYKTLGDLIQKAKKEDISVLGNSEKTDIKDRCKELAKLIK